MKTLQKFLQHDAGHHHGVAEAEVEVHLKAVHGERKKIEAGIIAVKQRHNAFPVELGLSPLP